MRTLPEDQTEKHALALHVAGLGLGSVDYLADTITLDARAAEMFDLPADTAIARKTLHARIHPEDWPKIDYQVDRLLDPDNDNFIDVQHRVIHRDGEIRWVSARKQVTFADRGDGPVPTTGLVAIMDITEHKEAQQRVRELMDELNHRSKNLLTVVQALARRTLASGPVDTFEKRFYDRLDGLVQNMNALAKEAWRHADLTELARSHLAPFVGAETARVTLSGPETGFDADMAQAIGMAFHELATNAVKYGALSTPAGRIHIEWARSRDGEDFEITWQEVDGPTVRPPERQGFGQSVMTDMVEATVSGTANITNDPDGLIWSLKMPISSVRVPPKS